jgi:hypothetical protein
MRETREDIEEWMRDTVKHGVLSMMESDRVTTRIKRLIERSYELLMQKALQGENLPKWHDSMTSMIVHHDDNGRKYMRIKWVKL